MKGPHARFIGGKQLLEKGGKKTQLWWDHPGERLASREVFMITAGKRT